MQLQANFNNSLMENSMLKKEKAAVENTLNAQIKDIEQLRSKIKSLAAVNKIEEGEEADKLNNEIEMKNATIMELELCVKRLEGEVVKLKKQADVENEGSESLLAQIKDLHKELLHGKELYETQIAKMSEETEELKRKVEQISKENEKSSKLAQEENTKLKQELKQAEESLTKSEEKLKSLENKALMNLSRGEDKELLLKQLKDQNIKLSFLLEEKKQEIKQQNFIIEELKVMF